MHTRLLLAALILFGISSRAQDEDPLSNLDMVINWGPLLEIEDVIHTEVVHADQNYIYLQAIEKGGFFSRLKLVLAKYDKESHELVWSIVFEDHPEHLGKECTPEDVLVINGEFHIIYENYNRQRDESYVFKTRVFEDGSVGSLEFIAVISSDDSDEGSYRLEHFEHTDDKLLLVTHQYEEEDNRVINASILDSSLNESWKLEIEFPFSYEFSNLEGATITKTGNLILFFAVDADEDRGDVIVDDDLPNRSHLVYYIDVKTNEVSELNLGLEEYFVNNADLRLDHENGLMYVTGMYGIEKYGRISGTFFMSLDQDSVTIVKRLISPFDGATLLNFMDEGDIEDGDEVRRPFVLRDVIRRKDGGVFVLFEVYQRILHTRVDPQTHAVSSYYTYEYGDVIVQNINQDGELEWTNVIRKAYDKGDNSFGGFQAVTSADKIHVIYLDDEDNIDYWTGEEDDIDEPRLSKAVIAVVTMDTDGNMVYEVLGDAEDDDDLIYRPRGGVEVDGSEGEAIWIRSDEEAFRFGIFTPVMR